MANLIIGRTSDKMTTLWVRGDDQLRRAQLCLDIRGKPHVEEVELRPERDLTAAVRIDGLDPETSYDVEARFRSFGRDGGPPEIVRGRVRTFPPLEDKNRRFSFLHGSCNLSIVSLTNVGALAAGLLGTLASAQSFRHPGPRPYEWALTLAKGVGDAFVAGRFALDRLRASLGGPPPRPFKWVDEETLAFLPFSLVYEMTGFKQPAPILRSPFEPLRKLLEGRAPPAFMIHAGDQIYFDFPFPQRKPEVEAYRLAYKEAFFEDPIQREFFSHCPHFMTLDDHEIVDSFALDYVPPKDGDPGSYLKPALRAYDEYVASRQVRGHEGRLSHDGHQHPLWYEFEHGAARFLVLDTRTRRHRGRKTMLDDEQLHQLLSWLSKHRDRIKFVVSSVPFLAELRPQPREERGRHRADAAPKEEPFDERDDKWAGRAYRFQRDLILDEIHTQRIGRLVFLVGDMHCAYHATMRLGRPAQRVTLHELAGGPIHQVQFAARADFYDQLRGDTCRGKVPFRTWIQAFLGAATSVLQVTVLPGEHPEVRWRVVRTSAPLGEEKDFRSLAGRIDF